LQAVGGENSNRQDRELDLSGDLEIDASRRPGSIATIVGTVRMENSKSLPEQLFMRFKNIDSGETFAGPISEKGQFEFRHDLEKAGNYEVELVNQDRTIAVKSISATGAKVQGHTIALVGGSSVHLDILVSKGLGTVNGTVLRDGKPASQCLVLLVPQDTVNNRVLLRRDQSDSDGTFTLPNVVPGKYTLLAIQNGWDLEWANPTVLSHYLKQGQAVVVDTPRTYDIKVRVQ
jgi:hypothetical protein